MAVLTLRMVCIPMHLADLPRLGPSADFGAAGTRPPTKAAVRRSPVAPCGALRRPLMAKRLVVAAMDHAAAPATSRPACQLRAEGGARRNGAGASLGGAD